jgi:Na+/H+-translocating membrane pyrophosphatase
MKKFLIGSSLLVASALSSFGNAAADYDMAKVSSELTNLAGEASTLFNTIAPIVIAVVALGVLITFVKRVKKG